MTKKLVAQIGDLVRDRVSELTGVVTAMTVHLNMCSRMNVHPRVTADKPNDMPIPYTMDILDLEVLKMNVLNLSDDKLHDLGGFTNSEREAELKEPEESAPPAESKGGPPSRAERF